MLDQIIDWTITVLILAAGLGAAVFTVSYIAFFRSEATPAGRALRDLGIALTALFILVIVGALVGDYAGREFVRLVVYGFLTFTMWRLVGTLWRYRRAPIGIPRRSGR